MQVGGRRFAAPWACCAVSYWWGALFGALPVACAAWRLVSARYSARSSGVCFGARVVARSSVVRRGSLRFSLVVRCVEIVMLTRNGLVGLRPVPWRCHLFAGGEHRNFN